MPDITLSITSAKLAEFKTGFLKLYPVPIDNDTESEDFGEPLYTENDWLKEKIKQIVIRDYKRGKQALAKEAADPQIDEEIVT